MKTRYHFNGLVKIIREKGITPALKHDFVETVKRHPDICLFAASMYTSLTGKTVYTPLDDDRYVRTKSTKNYVVFSLVNSPSDDPPIDPNRIRIIDFQGFCGHSTYGYRPHL